MIDVRILPEAHSMGEAAAKLGAEAIRAAIVGRGKACIIVATGASQFGMLASLVTQPGIDWSRVTAFHLDEYVGLPVSHPASFRRYLRERFMAPLGGAPHFVPVDGEAADPAAEARRLGALIAQQQVDVCFAGIGENCHLAFNDPPADFTTEEPYLVVTLDAGCRQQQFGEGWFESLEAVPERAISMSVRQIMHSRLIILSVPDQRKAAAVRDALEGPVTPLHPASILQQHDNTILFLDPPAASLLTGAAASAR
jgi:glucosamine-6-phosphate deaminase